LLRVENVVKEFPVASSKLFGRDKDVVHAVDGVSFELRRGETLGLVGETGCGKSTLARCITRLYSITSGTVTFDGRDISRLEGQELREVRRDVQMIFQDPYGSLNPRRRVGSIISDPFAIHRTLTGTARKRRVQELMELVGLNPEHYNRYPHEFSGGQRQRIGVARALALKPRLIVCDEPVSALDVSIQAQVVNLLEDLQDEYRLAYVFIAHDLSVVRHISDRIAVMYLGRIMEIAAAEKIYESPRHPYTEALIGAIPQADGLKSQPTILPGEVPNPAAPPPGCRFHTRCPLVFDRCRTEVPPLISLETGRTQACWLHRTGDPGEPVVESVESV
jgi:oligopeptide/dipeptide ABC transporter ATP-binding protein